MMGVPGRPGGRACATIFEESRRHIMIQKLTLVSIGDTTSIATNCNLLVGTVKKLISFFFMIDIVLRLILILKAEVLRRTPENPPF